MSEIESALSSSGLMKNGGSSTFPEQEEGRGIKIRPSGREIDKGGLFVFVLNDT